jgi:N-alpha-acetyltransferase 40
MKTLEKLAKIWEMERVVLTLLINNEKASRFYKEKLGYTIDDTSPDKSDEPAYEILSKLV